MLITIFDSRGIIHKEFVPAGQTITGEYFLNFLKRLIARIRRFRPEYRDEDSWCLLHDNAPNHSSLIVRRFLAKNNVCVLNHPPYSLYLAPCDFYLFPKIKLKLKGCFFYDIPTIQRAATSTLEAIPQSGLQEAFNSLLNQIEGKETKGIHRRSKTMDWTTRGDEEDGGGSMERPCPSVEEGTEGGRSERWRHRSFLLVYMIVEIDIRYDRRELTLR
ncbi:hypothetical protein LAZ67_22001231, partial [Cordylochernes scorpioides]